MGSIESQPYDATDVDAPPSVHDLHNALAKSEQLFENKGGLTVYMQRVIQSRKRELRSQKVVDMMQTYKRTLF